MLHGRIKNVELRIKNGLNEAGRRIKNVELRITND